MPSLIAAGTETLAALYLAGLRSTNSVPIMEEIEQVAIMLDRAACLCSRISPKYAATLMVDDLQRRGLAVYPRAKDEAIIAELERILVTLTSSDDDA